MFVTPTALLGHDDATKTREWTEYSYQKGGLMDGLMDGLMEKLAIICTIHIRYCTFFYGTYNPKTLLRNSPIAENGVCDGDIRS